LVSLNERNTIPTLIRVAVLIHNEDNLLLWE
jgi:hypothetical protein